ncbi:hypothetical protein O5476_02565 [Escherichia coli]|nr:hypothetical protein [Escherichia coli]
MVKIWLLLTVNCAAKMWQPCLLAKVLPTVLEVIAEKVKAGRPDKEVEEAAKTVVHAATEAIILKSLVSPKP